MAEEARKLSTLHGSDETADRDHALAPPMDALANVAGDRSAFYTSLPTRSPETKLTVFRVRQRADELLWDNLDRAIKVAGVVVDIYDKIDPNGEIVQVIRSVFVDTEGKSYVTTSPHIFRALRRMIQTFGPPPWPGLVMFARKVKSATNPQKFYGSLDIVEEPNTEETAKESPKKK